MPYSRKNFIHDSLIAGTGFIFIPAELMAFSSGSNPTYAVKDRLTESEAADMTGFVGKKLEQTYVYRIAGQPSDELVEPFRHRTETHLWQSEFWGKWFTSAVLAYKYRPEPALMKVLQSAVNGLIATQTPDGYIGNYSAAHQLEQWDIWGRKYTMLGLL